jgi:transcriptional regulator of arginine metabolism
MNTWKDHLRDLVAARQFTTQHALVIELEARGYVVHQGSVSRELQRLGAVKRQGVYALPDETLAAPVRAVFVTASGCLVVLKTEPAFASVLGQAVDDAGIPGVIGTIAGDDTVFVATSGPDGSRAVGALFDVPVEV